MDRELKRALEASPEGRAYLKKKAAEKSASRARTAPRRKAGAAEKQAKRTEKAARTVNVRVEVFKRDEGRCVVCGAEATDMHHLIYGSGWRRVLETGKTCAAVCRVHHRAAHAGDMPTLDALLGWARGRGYTFAADALFRRIGKIMLRSASEYAAGARASSVRRAPEEV